MSSKRVAIPYKDVKAVIVGPKETFHAYRVQRLEMPANMPSTTINELGNPKHAGVITDIPEITATVNAFDVSPKIFSVLAGQAIDSYPPSGIDVSAFTYCDLIGYVKEANVAEHLKSFHGKYMKVTDFNYSYSVDGEATEEYTLAGSEKRYFTNDVVVSSGVLDSSNMFTLAYTPKVLKNGDDLLSCIVNGVWLEEGDEYSVFNKTVTVSGGFGNQGDVIQAVYHTASGVLTWTDISAPTGIPAAIRGKNIPVSIGLEQMFRVQSVNLRGSFPNTKVLEMGNVYVVGYITDPPEITGDITVLDTDNEIVALLTTGDKDSTDTEFGVDEYNSQTLQLDIEVKDPADNSTVLKTVRVPAMRITSDGISSSVGGQTTLTFSFQSDDGQCIVFSGVGNQ